jgi:hypothetical protein
MFEQDVLDLAQFVIGKRQVFAEKWKFNEDHEHTLYASSVHRKPSKHGASEVIARAIRIWIFHRIPSMEGKRSEVSGCN